MGDKLLDEIIARVVRAAHPERIILFGSSARGTSDGESDVDLFVVKATAHRRKLAMAIFRELAGVGCPVDVIVVTPDDIVKYREVPYLVIEPTLREGKVIYAA